MIVFIFLIFFFTKSKNLQEYNMYYSTSFTLKGFFLNMDIEKDSLGGARGLGSGNPNFSE